MRCPTLVLSTALLFAPLSLAAQESRPATSQPARTQPAQARPVHDPANPPAKEFNTDDSDAKAIQLADRVMRELGGRKAWDNTRYLTWNFFGARTHVWDRATGDHRLSYNDRASGEPVVILSNLDKKEGRAFIGGTEVDDLERRKQLLDSAYSAWVNDSYWLLMPYKLKDAGVTLTYLGERATNDGNDAEVIGLTFAEVGLTPQNKYHVYVGKESGLVEQWDFFRNAGDENPGFQIPWKNWQRHGDIMLSGDRGERQITDFAVLDGVPSGVFTSPEPVDLEPFMSKPADENQNDNAQQAAQAMQRLDALMGEWAGTLTGFAADGATQSLPITWRTERAFNGRWLRFEFMSTEALAPNRWLEWEGLFTANPETGNVETVWMTPRLRTAGSTFLDGRMIFFEKGRFDETGRVLTLIAPKQYGPEAPVLQVKSTFTIAADGRSFTVVDEEQHGDDWKTIGVFELKRM